VIVFSPGRITQFQIKRRFYVTFTAAHRAHNSEAHLNRRCARVRAQPLKPSFVVVDAERSLTIGPQKSGPSGGGLHNVH
jgi:hypothetical protein